MKSKAPHISRVVRTTVRLVAVAATIGTVAAVSLLLATPTAEAQADRAPSYGWPVKPFHSQHPVRGSFGDPRILGKSHSFHFGVDVSCANGTPVYATVSGRAYIDAKHLETVTVRADDGVRTFGFWHIKPKIRSGQQVIAYRTVLGTVLAPWEHVHLAEQRNGMYVNPLRPGAMGPYSDTTIPTLKSFSVESGGRVHHATSAHGRVDLVVEAYDRTPISIDGPWHGKPLTPALLEWRLLHGRKAVRDWRTALDFRLTYPSNDRWTSTYARSTRQNKKVWDARYRIYLVHGLDTRTLADGEYGVEVKATDIRGNTGTAEFTLTIANSL
jgi:hypothetical protein